MMQLQTFSTNDLPAHKISSSRSVYKHMRKGAAMRRAITSPARNRLTLGVRNGQNAPDPLSVPHSAVRTMQCPHPQS